MNEPITRMKNTPRKTAVQHAAIVTSSPYKVALEASKTNNTKTKTPSSKGAKHGKTVFFFLSLVLILPKSTLIY